MAKSRIYEKLEIQEIQTELTVGMYLQKSVSETRVVTGNDELGVVVSNSVEQLHLVIA